MINPEKELEDLVDALHAGAARLSQLVDELFHEPSDDSAEGVDVFGIGRGIERAQPIEQDVRLDDRLLGSRVNARLRAAERPPERSVWTAYDRGVHLNWMCPSTSFSSNDWSSALLKPFGSLDVGFQPRISRSAFVAPTPSKNPSDERTGSGRFPPRAPGV